MNLDVKTMTDALDSFKAKVQSGTLKTEYFLSPEAKQMDSDLKKALTVPDSISHERMTI